MSDWFEAEAKMTAEVVNEFAGSRTCKLVPMITPPNGRATPDNCRRARDIKGVFDWPWDKAIVKPEFAMESTRSPTLFVHADCLWRDEKAGDLVLIPYRGETLQFTIIDIRRDGESGVTFDLQQNGVQR